MTEEYYVGAEEVGRNLGLFPRLNYFVLFEQSPKLGESRKDIEKWGNDRLRLRRPTSARINAHTLEDLAEGLFIHASTSEEIVTVSDRYREISGSEESILILDEKGGESYMNPRDITSLKRKGGRVVAVTSDGEKLCKTHITENRDGDTRFIVRNYSLVSDQIVGYADCYIIDARQQNHPAWRWSKHIYGSSCRDLSLREQRHLIQKIESVMKEREKGTLRWSVKLSIKGVYPDIYEVVKG